MSLQYIIDGYNTIKHPKFIRTHKNSEDPVGALLTFIKIKKSTVSSSDKVCIVFDGYPLGQTSDDSSAMVIFSRKISADEKIKRLVEESANRKNLVVVSDDRDLRFAVKSLGAQCLEVAEFIKEKRESHGSRDKEILKPELSFSEIDKINQELRKIWLK